MDHVSLKLRLPPEMHKRLVVDAKRNRRSVNSEILWRIDTPAAAKAEMAEIEGRARALADHLAITKT